MNEINHETKNVVKLTEQPFGNTLIVGAGPAGIHVAVQFSRGWSAKLGLLNRPSVHTSQLLHELEQSQYRIRARLQAEHLKHLEGQVQLSHFYAGYENIHEDWHTIVLCTPCDSYTEVIRQLRLERMPSVRTIILISSSFGSNLLVTNELPLDREIEVISLSTYFAATKFEPSTVISSFTKAIKRRVYASSNIEKSNMIESVRCFLESMGTTCSVVPSPLEAESRSITMYVHPPLFINPFSLDQILGDQPSQKSMYKLYPEGPITPHTIHVMTQLWHEISNFLTRLGIQPLNLLQFMNDDNYPVHEASLSRYDIEYFPELMPIHQEYLLYIRYSSLLIDPFSIPDQAGKYMDFSAVPYKQVYQDENKRWIIPRIPFEDFKRLKLIYGWAARLQLNMPYMLELIELFEHRLEQFAAAKGIEAIHPDMFIDRETEDLEIICSQWERLT